MGYNRQLCFMKSLFVKSSLIFATILMMTSCFGIKSAKPDLEMPIAINTVNSVGLEELNLKHGADYTIMNTVSADATVLYIMQQKGKQIKISEGNGEFEIVWTRDEATGRMCRTDFKGIARFGFLNNTYGGVSTKEISPEFIATSLAKYRLISLAKARGADGVIEPIISTNVEDNNGIIVLKTTVTAKLMKLNADAK